MSAKAKDRSRPALGKRAGAFLAGAAVLVLVPWAAGEGTGVNWIRSQKDIPSFAIPAYRGSRYEAMIPHTLDIQERTALGVHALTSETDPDRDYLMYINGTFNANPPVLYHASGDICHFKFMESLPLMRLICGSGENAEVDRVWMSSMLRMIGPDGLVYWPTFPWAPRPDEASGGPSGGVSSSPGADQYAVPISSDGRSGR